MYQVLPLNPHKNFSGKVINPSSQTKKQRLREVLHLIQGHTAHKEQSWVSNPCLPESEMHTLPHHVAQIRLLRGSEVALL